MVLNWNGLSTERRRRRDLHVGVDQRTGHRDRDRLECGRPRPVLCGHSRPTLPDLRRRRHLDVLPDGREPLEHRRDPAGFRRGARRPRRRLGPGRARQRRRRRHVVAPRRAARRVRPRGGVRRGDRRRLRRHGRGHLPQQPTVESPGAGSAPVFGRHGSRPSLSTRPIRRTCSRAPPATLIEQGPGLFRSSDAGATWSRLESLNPPSGFVSLVIDPLRPYDGLRCDRRTGLPLAERRRELGLDEPEQHPTSALWRSTRDRRRRSGRATAPGVRRSTDQGAIWQRMGVAQQVYSLAFDGHDPATLYAGSFYDYLRLLRLRGYPAGRLDLRQPRPRGRPGRAAIRTSAASPSPWPPIHSPKGSCTPGPAAAASGGAAMSA